MTHQIEVKDIHTAHTKNESITVSHVERPYGKYSSPIVSIGASCHDKVCSSKVEIPYENIDDIISALNESKRLHARVLYEDMHAELGCDMGGGQ